jgi:hypothetical protein
MRLKEYHGMLHCLSSGIGDILKILRIFLMFEAGML